MMEADKIYPIFENPIGPIINGYYKNLGFLFSFLEIEITTVRENKSSSPIYSRLLIDVTASPSLSEFESDTTTTAHPDKRIITVKKIKKSIRSIKGDDLFGEIINSLPAEYKNIADLEWHQGNSIFPSRGGISYLVDSRTKYPSWIFLGAKTKLQFPLATENKTYPFPDKSKADYYLTTDIGLKSSEYPELSNFVCIRFIQNYLFLNKNRITKRNNEERIFISLGSDALLATNVLHSNEPHVCYQLFNQKNELIGQDELEISLDDIKTGGVFLKLNDASKNEEISKADIKLYVGQMLADWSSGSYIRSIRVNVKPME